MEKKRLSRRDFLRASAMAAVGIAAASCAQPTPVEKVVKETVVVEKEVEKVVKETVVVEKEVEKEVEKVVKETVVVEKEVQVPTGGYPVPREETLVINETGIQRIFDAANPFVPNALVGGWDQMCGSRLMYLNWASGESINMLVEDYEYNDDFTEITFLVRKEAHWNDGEPFTARDIEFTVDMVKSNTALSWGSTMQQWVDSMEVPDDYTIRFKFTKPNPRFHWYFKQAWSMPIIAKHEWEGQDPLTYKAFPPIGTGPYKFHSAVPEQRMLIWERDDNFWGKAMGLEAAPRYYIYQTGPPPEAEMADLADNYIDHAHSYTSDAALLRRSQELNPEVVLAPWRDPCPRGIWFNCAKYPLSLPEVRWAFFHCIDKEKAANVLYPWPTVPAEYHFADWGSNDKFSFDDILAEFDTSFDPAKGAAILDELGFMPGADGIRVDGEGNKMSYTIIVPQVGVTGEYPIALDFAENLGKIGVEAVVKWTEGAVFDEKTSTGDFDITSHWWCGNWQEPPMVYTDWQAWRIKPIGERATAGNWIRLTDPDLDAVTEKIEVMSPDDPAIVDLYREGFRLYMKNMPSVPVVQTTYVMPFNTHYWKGWPDEDKGIDNVPFTWWCEFRFVLFNLARA
jgi:peptide/nickel transport system substrate-binding protein